jgi:hypothetical protein
MEDEVESGMFSTLNLYRGLLWYKKYDRKKLSQIAQPLDFSFWV